MATLEPLLPILRATWDERKYKADATTEKDADKELAPSEVTKVLADGCFPIYSCMLLLLAGIFEGLGSWAEGCPCHGDELQEHWGFTGQRRRRRRGGGLVGPCLMKGRLLPDIAAGKLAEVLKNLCDVALTELLTRDHGSITPEQWATICGDFERARALMVAGLIVKMDWVLRLPWKLAVIAHHDHKIARTIGRRIVEEYDAMPNDLRAASHRVSARVLALGTEMRAQLEQFLAGTPMARLPALCREILVLKFICLAERYIEGTHSLVSRWLRSKRYLPVAVSLARRFPSMELMLQQHPECLQSLVECFEECRSLKALPALTGCAGHPRVLAAILQPRQASAKSYWRLYKVFSEVLYRCDISDSLQDTKAAQKHDEKTHRREAAVEAAIVAANEGGKRPWSYEAMVAFKFHRVLPDRRQRRSLCVLLIAGTHGRS